MMDANSWKIKVVLSGSDSVVKLTVPQGFGDITELHRLACEKLQVNLQGAVLQYLDDDFHEYINLVEACDIRNLMTLRVLVRTDENGNELIPASESSMCGNLRKDRWPTDFEIPEFDREVKLFLQSAERNFNSTGEVVTVPRVIKGKMLDAIADRIFAYTPYANNDQIRQVAESLVVKYPSLKCVVAPLGYEAWANSISFKMGNYRSKLRSLGSEEVCVNGGRRSAASRPDALPSAANIKKAKKGEVNFQPNLPANETEESMEVQRAWMAEEMTKSLQDWVTINKWMVSTFATRRKQINKGMMLKDALEQWPALFCAQQLAAEFSRLTNKRLDLWTELDAFSDDLIIESRAKKGKFITKIQVELARLATNQDVTLVQDVTSSNDITLKRTTVLRCLPMLFDEEPTCLYRDAEAEEDLTAEDRPPAVICQSGVYHVVVEMCDCNTSDDLPMAVTNMIGLLYAMNIMYPKKGTNTFQFIQQVLLQIPGGRLPPKVLSLYDKLMKKRKV